uniref:Pentraxin family member n=1 Tax=Geotrypetes seraphini TaxID=260995 RepID=A0A6P8PER8_GEOSA|nr:serum amyloid P-component-like [Geotrypetes seraphini]
MERLSLCCLFLMSILGTGASTDLVKNVFLFPKESITSYVIVRPKEIAPLSSFTVCLRHYTVLTRPYALFSVANPGKFNDILIYIKSASTYTLHIGDEEMSFSVPESNVGWKHLCTSWESSTGVVTLWINGKPLPRSTMKKGYSVGIQPIMILGQEQDSHGGSFDKEQSFVGEMADVQMWNFILPPNDIQLAMTTSNLINGNVLDWALLDNELKGDAIIQPKLQDCTYC